ncbi:MAG: ribonuclease P protein component [Chloroflexota bacterium]
MNRRFRLHKGSDYQAVHRDGRFWRHPLLVLGALPNETGVTRCGVAVTKRLGRAARRNRAKRMIREAVWARYDGIKPGWDLVFIAREGLAGMSYQPVASAVDQLLQRAGLLADLAATPTVR